MADFHLPALYRVVILFSAWTLQSQTVVDASTQLTFDKAIGTKNLAFNNGTIHVNPFRSIDETHRYFEKDNYPPGALMYDGQLYQNIQLKYDLLADVLVVKLAGENNKAGFNSVSTKVEYFSLYDTKFTNLDLTDHPDFVYGFYEEEVIAENLILYTKHRKERIEVLTNQRVFNRYYDEYDFVVYYMNKWYKVASERDVTDLFPEYNSRISDFYQMNASVEKSDKNQFMKNLFVQINSFLSIK